MVVCKFFLTNSCYYGDRCRFEHVLPNEKNRGSEGRGTSVLRKDDVSYDNRNSHGSRTDRYGHNYRENDSYHYYKPQSAPQQFNNQNRVSSNRQYGQNISRNVHFEDSYKQHSVSPAYGSVSTTFEEVLGHIRNDISLIECEHFWPLTSVGPVRALGSLPGWYDYSPEEIRWNAYLSKSMNMFDSYKGILDELLLQEKSKRSLFNHNSSDVINIVNRYMQQTPETLHCLNNDVFRCLSGNSGIKNFSFAGQNDGHFFNKPMTEENVSIPNRFNGGNNPFLARMPSAHNEEMEHASMNNETFNSNIFGGIPPASSTIVSKQMSQNQEGSNDLKTIFGFTDSELDYKLLSVVWKGHSPYTKINDLTHEELQQFKAPKFDYNKVPLVPPAREFC